VEHPQHSDAGSDTLVLSSGVLPGATPNFRFCKNCQGLFYAGPDNLGGICPSGQGEHVPYGENYTLMPYPNPVAV
jgi:hypothetical protein